MQLRSPLRSPFRHPLRSPFSPSDEGQLNPAQFLTGTYKFWWDPNDFSMMFQDGNGQTPVTAAGQTVGLILDKSQNTFASHSPFSDNMNDGLGSWTVSAGGWSATGPNSCSCDGSNVGSSQFATASANIPLVSGQYVRWRFTVAAVSGTLTMRPSTTNTTALSPGTYTLWSPGSGTPFFSIGAGGTCTITDVSIDYYYGILMRQTTPASRPLVQLDATTGYYYLEADGIDDGMLSAVSQNTGANRFTGWFGVTKSSDAAQGAIFEHLQTGATANAGIHFHGPTGAAAADYGFATRGNTTTAQRDADGLAAPNSSILVGQLWNAGATLADQVRARINGAAASLTDISGPTTNGNYASTQNLYLFRRNGATLPFAGRCYGAFGEYGVDTALPTMQAGEQYLATRMGITLP